MKIGIIDSGIGGFSILHALRQELPEHDYVYLADQLHFPYSNKKVETLQMFAVELVRSLQEKGCSVIIVACNTLTITALETMRYGFPEIPFIGTVPAVKPASKELPTGSHVVVLATENTARSEYLQKLISGLSNVQFTLQGTTELVQAIEAGDQDWVTKVLKNILLPIHKRHPIDAIVIGCTHFSFAENSLCHILPFAEIFDSRAGVLKQLERLLPKRKSSEDMGTIEFMSTLSGNETVLSYMYQRMTGLLRSHSASSSFSCSYIAGNI